MFISEGWFNMLKASVNDKKNWCYKIIFAILIYVIAYAMVLKQMSFSGMCDYKFHAASAMDIHLDSLLEYIFLNQPYFLWHIIVKFCSYLGFMPAEYAAATVSAVATVAVYLLVEKILKHYCADHTEFLSFLLLLVGPIYIPWYNSKIYLGQGTPNTWHNPTNLMVKPFAVACFFLILFILKIIYDGKHVEKKYYMILTALLFISTLAKPSFLQGFIPALGIYMIIYCIKNKFRDIKNYLFICLTFVPSVLWMLWTFVTMFYTNSNGGGIGVGWLKWLSIYSPNVALSMALLFMFPILYIILNIKKIYKKTDIQLSVIWNFIAWLEAALLFEKGRRMNSGNFFWGLLLSVFILWVIVSAYLVKDIKEMKLSDKRTVIKNSVLLVVFMLHLVCGILYLFRLFTIEGMWY